MKKILIASILGYSLVVRLLGVRVGLPYLHYWDEPFIVHNGIKMLKGEEVSFFNYPRGRIYLSYLTNLLHYLYLKQKNKLTKKEILVPSWWEISHPSFYLWNRVVTSLIGVGCMLIFYLILQELTRNFTPTIGLLLIGMEYWHLHYSKITVGVIFLELCLLFSFLFGIKFVKNNTKKYLFLCILGVGMAGSSRYQGIFGVIIPLTAYLLGSTQSIGKKKFFPQILFKKIFISIGIVFLCLCIFFLFNFQILKNFKTFLICLAWEVYHYRIKGHTGATSLSLLENFLWQWERMRMSLPLILFPLSGIGIVRLILTKKYKTLVLLLTFPFFWGLIMLSQKVNYHRNFLSIYPYLLIFITIGIEFFLTFIKSKKFLLFFYFLISLSFLPFYINQFRAAFSLFHSKDVRSQVIEYLNSLPIREGEIIGIAKEVKIHPLDRKKLKIRSEEFFHEEIKKAIKRYKYVVVGEYYSVSPHLKRKASLLNSLTPIDKTIHIIRKDAPYDGKIILGGCSCNPKLIILKGESDTLVKISSPGERKEVFHQIERHSFSHWSKLKWTHLSYSSAKLLELSTQLMKEAVKGSFIRLVQEREIEVLIKVLLHPGKFKKLVEKSEKYMFSMVKDIPKKHLKEMGDTISVKELTDIVDALKELKNTIKWSKKMNFTIERGAHLLEEKITTPVPFGEVIFLLLSEKILP